MDADAAAERIVKKIQSYMDVDENEVMTDEEQEEAIMSVLKILITEIATIALTATVIELTKAIEEAVENALKEKSDGHL